MRECGCEKLVGTDTLGSLAYEGGTQVQNMKTFKTGLKLFCFSVKIISDELKHFCSIFESFSIENFRDLVKCSNSVIFLAGKMSKEID